MRSIFSILALTILLSSCNNSVDQSDKRIISVSILPQKYFVESLLGEGFEVNVLIPPGTSPASYDPTPKQLKDLNQSEFYLKMGYLGFELAWMESIKKNHKDLNIVNLSSGINLIMGEEDHGDLEDEGAGEGESLDHDHDHSGVDPHIWMSPKSALWIAENTANALIRFDPACKDLIRNKLDSLKVVIAQLDKEMEAVCNQMSNKKFIIYHPALTYLARDYGLEQIAMEFEGKDPSAAHIKKLIDRAKNEHITVVFIQKEFDKENAKQISKDINGKLIQIDPLAENWEAQMRDLIKTFKSIQID